MSNDERLLGEYLATADRDRWLADHPDQRETVRHYLSLERSLLAARPGDGSERSRRAALERLLAALEEPRHGLLSRMPSPVLRLASVVAALALFAAATVGAGAFFTGANPIEEALEAIELLDHQSPNENANPNAFEGAGNADQGRDNANPNSFEGADNALQGRDNASPNANDPSENASGNALDGADNAGQGQDNAPTATPTPPPSAEPGAGSDHTPTQ